MDVPYEATTEVCAVFARLDDDQHLLYVLGSRAFPSQFRKADWRQVAFGVAQPERGKSSIYSRGFYEIWPR